MSNNALVLKGKAQAVSKSKVSGDCHDKQKFASLHGSTVNAPTLSAVEVPTLTSVAALKDDSADDDEDCELTLDVPTLLVLLINFFKVTQSKSQESRNLSDKEIRRRASSTNLRGTCVVLPPKQCSLASYNNFMNIPADFPYISFIDEEFGWWAYCTACDKVIRTRKKGGGIYGFTMEKVNEHASGIIHKANVDEKDTAKLAKENKDLKGLKVDRFVKGRLTMSRKSQVDMRQFAVKRKKTNSANGPSASAPEGVAVSSSQGASNSASLGAAAAESAVLSDDEEVSEKA